MCARVDIGVTESPTKIILKIQIANKKKKKTQFGSDIFYIIAIIIKVGVRIPFSVGNFQFVGRAEKPMFFLGGGITSKLARQ